ncbi:dioxygenase family protein [Adhaeretor mobilis]|uniref:Protocatechuate 3,4-dioxygenase beta chain n=1 Tax=Adhaeretor mobilis TaxID=1930276 RepID=A0A517MPJ3_9BACT|nr:protocatechuate 3,4-dioxygenase [Adhaeretor mobilis]QDS96805.1 Protocatechuate 3,4-dioxygenase beta chain [Adhaeretor mobilis]
MNRNQLDIAHSNSPRLDHATTAGVSRRRFLNLSAAGLATLPAGAFAQLVADGQQLATTPRATEGPFYPDHLPLDTDNDLLIINDKLTPAVGEITHLGGRVLDQSGAPMRNVVVEIWQVDGNGVYLHSRSGGRAKRDTNFQGFGRFLTNRKGEYYFRTVKPVTYPGRTPHIHFAINRGDRRLLTTQMYVKGAKQNERDGILSRIHDAGQRKNILVDFKPLPESKTGELVANFDIVLGKTPEDG